MKALILAAGKGSRISKSIGNMPKSMVKLSNGETVIRRTVRMFLNRGIKPVVCVGYCKELIYRELDGLDVEYYENPFYDITNNIVSMWFAKEAVKNEDIIFLSADIYFPDSFIDLLINNHSKICMLVDKSRLMDGDFYFNINDENEIMEYGPKVSYDKRCFEYVGLSKITLDETDNIYNEINQCIDCGEHQIYFEDMLIRYVKKKKANIDFIDVKEEFWREFDFYEDYIKILEFEKGVKS